MKIIFKDQSEKDKVCQVFQKLLDCAVSGEVTSQAPICSFDEFWSIYPRKVGKKPTEAKFKRLKAAEKGALIERVRLLIKTQWSGKDISYIPHAQTFINQRRWEDEIEVPKTIGPQRPQTMSPAPEITEDPPVSNEQSLKYLQEIKESFKIKTMD